jgi:hypothetical protein
MLLLIMELKGKFNHKVIKKAKFSDQHFDESMNFISVEKNVRSTPRFLSFLIWGLPRLSSLPLGLHLKTKPLTLFVAYTGLG